MVLNYDKFNFRENWAKRLAICGINLWTQETFKSSLGRHEKEFRWYKSYIIEFKNIITGKHFNNKKDNQKLKHGGKELK